MPKTKTSFTVETAPRKAKGCKRKTTIIKEAIGLDGWKSFENYLLNNGAAKLLEEMNKLKGKDFVMAYDKMAEFVKPKLARMELTGKEGQDLTIRIKEI